MVEKCVPFETLFEAPLRNGVSYPAKTRGSGVPMINMREIFAYDRVFDQECERVPLTRAEQQTSLLNPGDLLFARQSLTYEGAGRCVLVMDGGDRTWDSHIIRVRLERSRAEPSYFYYYFRSPRGRRKVEQIVHQVAAAGIRGSDLRRLLVPVPELARQQAIAEVLGALDNKIAANDWGSNLALDLSRTIFGERVRKVPEVVMSKCLEPVLGGTPPRANSTMWNGPVPWASAKDITGAPSGVVLSTSETITELAATKARTRALPTGTVVLTARGTVGAVARLGVPAAINQSCYGFPPGVVPPACLFLLIESVSSQARALVHGSVFDTITMKTFDHVTMPDLLPDEWNNIEAQLAHLLKNSTQMVSESVSLAATRDELLPLLMSGKVRVRDAEKVVEEVV